MGLALILALGIFGHAFGASMPAPFNTEPFTVDARGNAAGNSLGSFRANGGPPVTRIFLGTNFIPGTLIMDWAEPFRDGPGDDFAILTSPQGWGALADRALFQVFSEGEFQTSFTASLGPGQLFRFDFPDNNVVGDRIILTNITPDPPEVNNLADMAFDNAGVTTAVVPVPPAIALFGSSVGFFSLLAYLGRRRRDVGIGGAVRT
jgi:hypothetical protein